MLYCQSIHILQLPHPLQDILRPYLIAPEQGRDFLHMAINMRTQGAAVQLLAWALQDTSPSQAAWQIKQQLGDNNLVLSLLHTAVQRGHAKEVELLSQLPAALQLPPAAVRDFILAACRSADVTMTQALCHTYIIRCLDTKDVHQLLTQAIRSGSPATVAMLIASQQQIPLQLPA